MEQSSTSAAWNTGHHGTRVQETNFHLLSSELAHAIKALMVMESAKLEESRRIERPSR